MTNDEQLRQLINADADRERLYAAVGKVASNWSVFEHFVHSSLWVLAKVDDDAGACLTSQIAGPGRALDAFAALVRVRGGDDPLIKLINQFAAKTRTLGEKRNRAVHDSWNWNKDTGKSYRLQITAQKTLVMGPQPAGTNEMNTLVDLIADHIEEFEKIVELVEKQLGASAGICFRPPAAGR